MQHKKCLATLGAALIIVIATLTLASGAAAGTCKALYVFKSAGNPQGNLIFDAAGNLYGTAQSGGAHGHGTVFKLKPNADGTWTESSLHNFTGADGDQPRAGLIFDAAGNLYGTTYVGGADGAGVVFKLAPNPDGTWTESVLYSFTGGADGGAPVGRVILDAAGNLYGTAGGVKEGQGVVFKLKPNLDGSWTYSVLHSFTYADGSNPLDGLIFDGAGNLYGTTEFGGAEGAGVVFKLAPNPDGTWTESVLHSFTGDDGAWPFAGLIFDAAGNLYGTTYFGGAGDGVVFKLKLNRDGTWTGSVLHSFTGPDGGDPSFGGLIFDAAGNLYGTTSYGGAGYGVVFKLTPTSSGWSETVLHSFLGFGRYPSAGVIRDAAGNLYGTTPEGSTNYGLVFEITR